jgi:hypothetical protein
MSLRAYELTDDHKIEFLELIYAGHRADTAAREVGTTGTQFKKLKNPSSQYYDEYFAEKWAEAEASEEHHRNREGSLRDLVDERSQTSDAILKARMQAELPEYRHLRDHNVRHEISGVLAHKVLPHVSKEALDAAIEAAEAERALERGEIKLLPPVEETG